MIRLKGAGYRELRQLAFDKGHDPTVMRWQIVSLYSTSIESGFDPLLSRFEPRSLVFLCQCLLRDRQCHHASMPRQPNQLRRRREQQHNGEGSSSTTTPSIMEHGGNSSMISRARVHAGAQEATAIRAKGNRTPVGHVDRKKLYVITARHYADPKR